ncbi:MAG: valine--tRNA ligase, partial [Desulfobulbaceae bacterium]|nr:valine--tRNA ligase [Desulfobulbaceae bacterium]
VDWQMARENDLKIVKVINEDGKINKGFGKFSGKTVLAAREMVVKKLQEQGIIEREENFVNNLSVCERCKTAIEPLVSEQWFVNVDHKNFSLKKEARKAIESGKIKIYPERFKDVMFSWIDNVHDWCISRQIWWGHRIPAWICESCGELIVKSVDPDRCPKCKATDLTQETDVLDTWFSSALWPFSTLGWPESTKELSLYYPTSVLITSFDILFFWVSRMIMMGIHFMGEIPFKDVYLHALVRDEHGKKMSKSKGNVMDPILVMDKYGTDALRFTMTAFAAQGRDIRISEERIEGYRHFINKVWNASRFVLMHIRECDPKETASVDVDNLSLPHQWILSRTNRAVSEVIKGFEDYRFNDSALAIYQFVWREFCDWYLEWIKPALYGDDQEAKDGARRVLFTVLEITLKLLHPITPFVTEEIWHVLPGSRESIMTEPFPEVTPEWENREAEATMTLLMGVIGGIRNIRSEMMIHPSASIEASVICSDEGKASTIERFSKDVKAMTRVTSLSVMAKGECPKGAASYIYDDIEIYVPVKGLVDFEKEIAKLTKEKGKVEAQLKKTRGKLLNEKFLANAPKDVVEKEKEKERTFVAKLTKIDESMARLSVIEGD